MSPDLPICWFSKHYFKKNGYRQEKNVNLYKKSILQESTTTNTSSYPLDTSEPQDTWDGSMV